MRLRQARSITYPAPENNHQAQALRQLAGAAQRICNEFDVTATVYHQRGLFAEDAIAGVLFERDGEYAGSITRRGFHVHGALRACASLLDAAHERGTPLHRIGAEPSIVATDGD